MIISGKHLFMTDEAVISTPEIPKGNWLVRYNEMKDEFFLEKIDDFTLPEKIYGDVKAMSKRYLNTFNKYDKNLGIALTGLKGTGKSLLAKQVCMDSNLAVIIIDEKHLGSSFNAFIQGISQRCIIFIDEFEKIYDREEEQNNLLSLLDGVFMGKKIFLFTSNETSKYSNHLLNRPGRIHYLKDFIRIDDNTLQDIIDNNLINKEHEATVKDVINVVEDANIDMVMALIREMNDYGEDAKEAVKYLNIKISSKGMHHECILLDNKEKCVYTAVTDGNPMFSKLYMRWELDRDLTKKTYKLNDKQLDKREDEARYWRRNAFFEPDKFKQISIIDREFTLVGIDNENLVLKIKPMKEYSYVF